MISAWHLLWICPVTAAVTLLILAVFRGGRE